MDPSALHEHLAGLASVVAAPIGDSQGSTDGALVAEVEAHVSAGCSRCARALVNARDAAVSLAQVAPPAVPSAALRERIVALARARQRPAQPGRPRRVFDPAGEVARLHLGAPGDADRSAEVDALGVGAPPPDDACPRYLAQIQGLIGFPLLFVSVIRGDRCGYRAQIGLPIDQQRAGRDRRRETTFCTHTVSTGAPMVVPSAATEPFFRGSNMVLREGIGAYVGVPIVTSRGIAVGTVCAMDHAPRRIGPEVVRVLTLFTEPILAEIERRRGPRTAAGTPLHPARWFRALIEVAEGARPGSVVVVAEGARGEALADGSEIGEPAGLIGDGRVGLLRAGRSEAGGEAGCEAGGEAGGAVVEPPFAKLFR